MRPFKDQHQSLWHVRGAELLNEVLDKPRVADLVAAQVGMGQKMEGRTPQRPPLDRSDQLAQGHDIVASEGFGNGPLEILVAETAHSLAFTG